MKASSLLGAGWENGSLEVLWEDAERAFCRTGRGEGGSDAYAFIPLPGDDEHSAGEVLSRMTHEFQLKDYLDSDWALRPLDLVRERGRILLVVDYEKGEPLNRLMRHPMEIGWFLRVAASLAAALGHLHGSGLIHKDIKPANVIVDPATGQVRLTGFGIASRLPRERQAPEPPEFIAGTLAYMAPEQTGRVNRSVDSRSDLYSLGVTFYEMLTGSLPFMASDPMEWVHCHVATEPKRPSEQLESIPACISAITMKLLSKTAEERYQTAAGIESDLRRCLCEWDEYGRISDFELGTQDMPDRLMIPEQLYGRDRELDTLLNAFDRIVAGGRPELVLVSGYSGIGKSAVVNELHKPLVPPRGLFAAGKFDQYKRDIPYATLAQAFQSLIRPLLSKKEDDLSRWRDLLCDALDPNGQLMVDLVPELKHIIGEQPPVPELPPQDAQRRFQLVFRRFISVFARPEHPLALFLDDLQWLDAATLDLLEDMLTRTDLKHLLLIGAYRDNEVSATHPLVRKLDAIRQAGAVLQDIVLAPLSRHDLGRLLADSLHCGMEGAAPLAQLIHEKTSGNPFFAIQFISALADERLLAFDHAERRWSWNLDRIRAKGYTDNVVELMIAKLTRLPIDTQKAMQQFACMGNSAEFGMLQKVYQSSIEDMHQHLWEAVRTGLIFRSENSYHFLHDRVQEGAYSLIPESKRAEAHLRIGMLLAEHIPPEEREEAIFEIVNQLNRGSRLIASSEVRARVAEFNLIAGRRAKTSTAYASALKYLRAGRTLLSDEAWEQSYGLVFQIEYLMAECELLTADMASAEDRLERLAERTNYRHDFCLATRLRLTLYTTLDRCDRSVDVFLDWLRRQGTDWSNRPSREDATREYDRIWTLLGDRQIEELLDMPLITDPCVLDTLDVFTEIVTPATLFDEHLSSLIVCRLVTLSLEHGNSDAAGFAYVWLAMFAGPRFGNYRDGFRFGQLGYDLVEKRGLTRYQARTYMSVGAMVMPWEGHVANGRELVRRAFDAAHRIGDLTFAAYSWDQLITICLAVGDPLAEVQSEAENGLVFARMARFGLVIELCESQLGLIQTLRGVSPMLGSLDHPGYGEIDTEHRLAGNPNLVFAEFYYWTRKLQARFIVGDIASAVDAAQNGQRILWTSAGMFETADFHLYAALAHASAHGSASADKRCEHLDALLAHHRQIEVWAELNPATFENRAALVGAELARVEGRWLEAQDLFEKAIRSSKEYGFVHNEAIANELAGRFYDARGFEKIAIAYLRDARHGYLRWGADGKVRQLDERYPQLRLDKSISDATSTILTSVERLDLATVIKVSEAVSGEMVFEKLIDTLMRTALEHAGAQRGLLILPKGDEYQIVAEVRTGHGGGVTMDMRHSQVTAENLPESVLRYVVRTKEIVVLQDATGHGPFSTDDYVGVHHARSVLCIPILKQAMLLGILYLENNLTPDAFTPSRMAILKLLASEASISMENARLYQDLANRESRIRRLVDANIIGIFIWDLQGRILEANEAFLRMLGYDHEDPASKHLRWTDLTPPEWLDGDRGKRMPTLKSTGRIPPYEKEFFRKDGIRIPVLIGVAAFEEEGTEGVAFVLDLSERKHATDTLRELQAELAHANRLATMGQLVATIAHEVIQPIGAARNNANAALRFLAAEQRDLGEVREAIECVVSDTYRAGNIVGRIRDQVKKLPPRQEGVDLNYAIEEVIALVRGELSKNHVEVQMRLTKGLPPVHGDRVQLQQVILNLVINAIEAMANIDGELRQLSVSTASAPADVILVAVGDSGPGVDLEYRERIFESFYTTKADGVGIGLSICRSIIEAHGGSLWVDPAQSRGAIFRFSLPVNR
ncbi:ATP-binding sensor histidine kinase [Rhodanobacter sp. MP7CTX1]|uniref:trifunctional serine/threonine-protein kinase/ATP-binding protein/sensor histidine kinase n=1 Tax=Rhodanobacter sp. MP7CTX1 TaxID=2723084 RepID=UPI00161E65AE|nr:ATP-binding sensor histidine kinase [Rhodanobacter sp. MP7CTX1]MBB6186643.1 PAS domain S-box-containing protein [Rhodanobacter sp. MP7CTX1]